MIMFWKEDSGRQLRLITPKTTEEMRPAFHHHQDLPSLMILMFLLILLTHHSHLLDLLDRQIRVDYLQDYLPTPPPAGGNGRARAEDDDDNQSPQDEGQRQRSRSRDRVHPYAQASQTPPIPVPQTPPVPPIQPMVIQEPFTVPDEDSGSSGRRQRSRSRERAPVHVPLYTDDELWNHKSRVSDRSRSPQRKESPQRQKERKKTTAEVQKPSDLPSAKKHKPMDSDEDDEVPQNAPGTSSNTQPPVPVLPLQSGSTSSSHGPSTSTTSTSSQRTSTSTSSEDESADNDDEHGEGESGPAIQSARSHDSGRKVLYPDLLTNDEHWTMTPEAHKYAAAAGSFCFVTENGEQQDIYNLTTIPGVQRSLCLDEVIDDSSSTQVEFPKGVDSQTRDMLERCMATCGKAARARAKRRSRARKEASAKKVRRYYKQFAEAKHLEWKSWIDNEVFDLVDLRKFKPKNYVTGRWVLTSRPISKATSSGRRLDGYCEVSKINRKITCKPILLRPRGQDFG